METKKQTTKAQLISDVSKPGTAAPASATSRPVIVTNRPLMQDPMMAPAAAGEDAAKALAPEVAKPAAQPSPKVVIKPLDSDEAEAVAVAVKPANPEAAPAVAEAEPADEVVALTDKDSLAKQTAALEADAKAQDELDQLVEDKTYFLPINASVHRRSRKVFIFGMVVIILLVLAWLNIAMDAGFVSIPGVHPVTHLFSN